MSLFTQFVGGKPISVTTYTSGSGNYSPSATNAWCYVTVVGGGGGGEQGLASMGGAGGTAGAVWQQWIQLSGSTSYAVGAGGASSTDGSNTTFGTITAVGGQRGGGDAVTIEKFSAAALPGESGQYGSGGRGGRDASKAGGAGGGYGAGGGGGCLNTAGGAGSGGLIIIQDFGP